MTDLYEAGDINQTDSGDAVADVNHADPGDAAGDAGEGNERHAVDGGTPLAVLTYLARALSNDPDAVIQIDNEKAVKWLVNGAKPTERVERLLKTSGAWDEFSAAKAK